jgi:quercetin dioxygenase-like cupin family protein
MQKKTRALIVASVLLATTAVGSSAALATPGGGPNGGPAPSPIGTATTVASYDLDGPFYAKQDRIRLGVDVGDAKVRTFTLKYPPKSFSGWHEHPGLVLATVLSGEVTRTLQDCRPKTFKTGEAFYEQGPHYVQNKGTVDAVLGITHIYPANANPDFLREDLPTSPCPPKS